MVVVDVRVVVVVVRLTAAVTTPELIVCVDVELCLNVLTAVDEGWKLDWVLLVSVVVTVTLSPTGVAC